MPGLLRRAATAAAAVVLFTGLAPAAAHATPSPSTPQPRVGEIRSGLVDRATARRAAKARANVSAKTHRAITLAVQRSEATSFVPARDYRVTGVRLAGSDWARATLTPRAGAELDPATVVLQRAGTPAAWTVADLGTAGVGCDIAPASVLRTLRLTCE